MSERSSNKQEVESFGHIIKSLRERVKLTAIGYLHETEDAEDVVQEAYLYKNQISDIPSNMSLRTYVYSWNSTGHPRETSENSLTAGGGNKEESKRSG